MHWQEALGIGRIASLDDDIEDQAALAGGQVELVSILHVTGTFDDDVGMRLEQTYQLLAGRHRLADKDAPLALGEKPRSEKMAQNLKRTFVFNNGIMPLGLLRDCMEYALNDNTRIEGVFQAAKAKVHDHPDL